MKKSTKTLMLVGGLGVVGYLLYTRSQSSSVLPTSSWGNSLPSGGSSILPSAGAHNPNGSYYTAGGTYIPPEANWS